MNRIQIVTLLLISCFPVFSQKEGDTWVMGYSGEGSKDWSIVFMNFTNNNLSFSLKLDINGQISESTANICDASGNPIIWTNGMEIFGPEGVYISDTIAYDGEWGYWQNHNSDEARQGFRYPDGVLILPVPESETDYYVIYHTAEWHPDGYNAISRFWEARVRLSMNASYEIVYQDSLLGSHHQWYAHRIESVRHANGRDWWIAVFEAESKKYHCYILNPYGIQFSHSGETNSPVKSGLGQACFSPKGNYYARMDATTFEEGQFLTLYSFDRCIGQFDIIETFHSDAGVYTGTAFSQSEQYLYGNNNDTLWQWNLWSENITESKKVVGVFDGFVEPGWFPTYLGLQVLAPDGKIYMMPASSTKFMHVINRPNLAGDESKFRQRNINLTVPNRRAASNIPNFRLGPADGSPCDTLGIDNIPVSRWRYEENEPGWYHQIRFTDLSFYDPQNWYWDFGDGETSDEQSPVHYFEDGLYHVCLTVSNDNGTDSTCQWIEILPTDISEPTDTDSDLSIHPNPFDTELHIQSKSGVFRTASFQFFDMHGRLVLHQPEIPVPLKISLPSLPSGIYLCRIEEGDGTLYSFKVMKR